jgi:hypothetical protein
MTTSKQLPVRKDAETSRENGRSGQGFDQPLNSCRRRSWKGPLKVIFKDAENQDVGLVAQNGPDDSRVGEELYMDEVPLRLDIVR